MKAQRAIVVRVRRAAKSLSSGSAAVGARGLVMLEPVRHLLVGPVAQLPAERLLLECGEQRCGGSAGQLGQVLEERRARSGSMSPPVAAGPLSLGAVVVTRRSRTAVPLVASH